MSEEMKDILSGNPETMPFTAGEEDPVTAEIVEEETIDAETISDGPFPAAGTSPAEETYPAEEVIPEDAVYPAGEGMPSEEAAPAEAAYPVEETMPAEASYPAEETVPADAAYPAEETVPAEEQAPFAEEAPFDETAPAAEAVSPAAEAPFEEAAPEAPAPRSRKAKKRSNRGGFIAGAAVVALLAGGCGAYYGMSQQYRSVFFPNTTLNGINVSGLTAEETETLLKSEVANYQISVKARGAEDAVIKGSDIGLTYNYSGAVDQLIAAQKPLMWGQKYFSSSDYSLPNETVLDDALLSAAADRLACMDESSFIAPEAPRMSEFDPETGYTLIPTVDGTTLDREKAKEAIRNAALSLSPDIDLDDDALDLYASEQGPQTEEEIQEECSTLNRYCRTEIRFTDQGDAGEVLNGDTIRGWLTIGENGQVSVDEDKVRAYVKDLAEKTDTYGKPHKFMTSWDKEIELDVGDYGWQMDQEKEVAFILDTLGTSMKVDHPHAYLKEAASHGENDFGTTYVEVNLSAQHLYYYVDGELIVESDFVSGKTSQKRGTTPGFWHVAYKQRDAILRGQGYASPVNFWMPFHNGEGLHDAPWRSEYGGSIYKYSGSHGCVNMPYDEAKTMYEHMTTGTPVIVFYLEGTESSKTSSHRTVSARVKAESAAPAVTLPAPLPEMPVETQPVQQPVETSPETQAYVSPENYGPGFTQVAPETAAASYESGPGVVSQPSPAEYIPETAAAQPAEPGMVGPGVSGPASVEIGPGVVGPGV